MLMPRAFKPFGKCHGQAVIFLAIAPSLHVATSPCENDPFQFSLCLSRAYLGKLIICILSKVGGGKGSCPYLVGGLLVAVAAPEGIDVINADIQPEALVVRAGFLQCERHRRAADWTVGELFGRCVHTLRPVVAVVEERSAIVHVVQLSAQRVVSQAELGVLRPVRLAQHCTVGHHARCHTICPPDLPQHIQTFAVLL